MLAVILLRLGILEAQILSTEVTIGLDSTQQIDLDSDGKAQDVNPGVSAVFEATITIGAELEQIDDVMIEFRPKSGEGPANGPNVKFRAYPVDEADKRFDESTSASVSLNPPKEWGLKVC